MSEAPKLMLMQDFDEFWQKVDSETKEEPVPPPKPKPTPLVLPVKTITLCWNCGYPGHARIGCTKPSRIFCSRCGTVGIKSRDCKCENPPRHPKPTSVPNDHGRGRVQLTTPKQPQPGPNRKTPPAVNTDLRSVEPQPQPGPSRKTPTVCNTDLRPVGPQPQPGSSHKTPQAVNTDLRPVGPPKKGLTPQKQSKGIQCEIIKVNRDGFMRWDGTCSEDK